MLLAVRSCSSASTSALAAILTFALPLTLNWPAIYGNLRSFFLPLIEDADIRRRKAGKQNISAAAKPAVPGSLGSRVPALRITGRGNSKVYQTPHSTGRSSMAARRRNRRTLADSLSEICAYRFRKSSGAPRFEQDGCASHHDSIRTPHLRAMARPARTHQEHCPRSFSAAARIFHLGQVEFRRRPAIRLTGVHSWIQHSFEPRRCEQFSQSILAPPNEACRARHKRIAF